MSNYNNKNETNVSRSTNVKIGGTTQEIKIGAPEGEDEIARAFAVLLQRINTLPDGSAKNNARIAVNQLQEEAKQGDRADENSIGSLFHFLPNSAVKPLPLGMGI